MATFLATHSWVSGRETTSVGQNACVCGLVGAEGDFNCQSLTLFHADEFGPFPKRPSKSDSGCWWVWCVKEESSFLFLVPHPNTDWTSFAPFETFLFSHWIVDKLKSLDQFPFENKLYSALCVVELNYLIIFAFVVVCGNLSCLILLAYSGWCVENPADLCLIPANKKGKTPTHFCPLNRGWWNWHLTFCLHA